MHCLVAERVKLVKYRERSGKERFCQVQDRDPIDKRRKASERKV